MTEQLDEQGRPIRCKVGALTYEIRWMDKDWQEQSNFTGFHAQHLGYVCICETLQPSLMAVIFMHEILHAMHWQHTDEDGGLATTEKQAHAYSYAIAGFFRDNPNVAVWWTGLLNGEGVAR